MIQQPAKSEIVIARNVEDTCGKLIRLIANLSTDEQFIEVVNECGEKSQLAEFMNQMVSTL